MFALKKKKIIEIALKKIYEIKLRGRFIQYLGQNYVNDHVSCSAHQGFISFIRG